MARTETSFVLETSHEQQSASDEARIPLHPPVQNVELTETRQYESDKEGSVFCGITLDWDYENRTVDLSMPGYVEKALVRFKHPTPRKPQHAPYPAAPIEYGKKSK